MSSAIISTFSSSKSSLSAPADVKQTAFNDCVARIKSAISQIEIGFRIEQLSEFDHLVTDFSNVAVINCGHLFNGKVIEALRRQNKTCPTCHSYVSKVIPVHALRQFASNLGLNVLIITCSEVKESNPRLANKLIQFAKKRVEEKAYEEALELYHLALQHINSSEVYAAIPALYDQLKEEKKALLSRLYLSLYQLQEGKIQEAIDTLVVCKSYTLIAALKLHLSPSSENIEQAMQAALHQSNPNDRIFIYQQILLFDTNLLDAYQQLISLIKDPKKKQNLLLKAAEQAHATGQFDAEMKFLKEAELPLIPTVISEQGWMNPLKINLPPYPQELKDFLAGNCTIWPEHIRAATHIVVPCFPEVLIDDVPTPLTFCTLTQLANNVRAGSFFGSEISIAKDHIYNSPPEKDFYYGVMTTDAIPGSKNLSYEEQLRLLESKGYELPTALEAALALLWANQHKKRRYFSNREYTRCRDTTIRNNFDDSLRPISLVIGNFSSLGTDIPNMSILELSTNCREDYLGSAGWRTFRL